MFSDITHKYTYIHPGHAEKFCMVEIESSTFGLLVQCSTKLCGARSSRDRV